MTPQPTRPSPWPLTGKGYLEGAIIEFREALRHHPDDQSARVHLGKALLSKGDYAQAVEQFREALQLAGSNAEQHFPDLRRLLAQVEHLATLVNRLPAILRGAEHPKDSLDALELAHVARAGGQFAAATRLSADALTAEPTRADDLKAGERYKAACLAALAGCGLGKDDPKPDANSRAKLRSQALAWLKADLGRNALLLEEKDPAVRKEIADRLARWQKDPDLAGVRDEAGLAIVPRQERQAWKRLWSEVDADREKALENQP